MTNLRDEIRTNRTTALGEIREIRRAMTTTTTEAKILIEAYDTLRAIEGFAIREVFTGGLAAVDNGDRPAVDKSIARLNAWSENAVYGARIKCRAGGLQDAATYARAARTVWAYYVHHQPS